MSRVRKTVSPWVKLVLLFVLVTGLVLGIVYLVIKRNDEAEESAASESESSEYVLWEHDVTEVASISSERADGTTTILSRLGEYDVIVWYQAEYPEQELGDYYADMVTLAESVTAFEVVRENPTEEDLELFGLKTPSARFVVTMNDGTEDVMLIGSLNLKGNYCYAMLEGTDKIYSISYMYRDYAMHTTLELYELDINQITATGNFVYAKLYKKGNPEIWLKGYDSTEGYQQNYSYPCSSVCFIAPFDYRAVTVDPEFLATVFDSDNIASVEGFEIVSISATPEELEEYGLTEESCEYYIHMVWLSDSTNDDGEYTVYETEYYYGYSFGDNGEYSYFRQGTDNAVYVVDTASATQFSYEPLDYACPNLFLSNIEYIDSLDISFGQEAYSFKLTSGTEAEETVYEVEANGKEISESGFKSALADLFLLKADSCLWEAPTEYDTKDFFRMVYHQKDGTVRDITCYRFDDFTYIAQMGDGVWFVCNYYQFDLIKEEIRNLCTEKT